MSQSTFIIAGAAKQSMGSNVWIATSLRPHDDGVY
jgi:hypothetical protein